MVGKWHLGMGEGYRPWERGFDEYFGFLHGQHSYTKRDDGRNGPVFRGEKPVEEPGYLTDLFGREAVSFIDRHKQRPFFLYLTFNAVHVPLEAPKKYLDEFESVEDTKRKTMLAMLSAMDDAVGKIMEAVRRNGLEETTLIFFIGDNGGYAANSSRNDPFAGFKTDVLERGIREPFFMQWKGRVPAGRMVDTPVIQLDIFATAVAAARGKMPMDRKMDGVDLVPYASGEKTGEAHEYLFWRFGPQKAVRKGHYKYEITPRHGTKLVDLSQDVKETTDLSKERPEVLAELKAALEGWEKELKEPLWNRNGGDGQGAGAKK
jgi:arylsulfatase A-like enzyme